jgi:CO/xanthine dehydrogenase Mo-binding subunit
MADAHGGARSTIGLSVPRRDGTDKVRGATRYSADVGPPGTLWGAILRSPLPHARIVAVDARAARALRGVHAVLVGADVTENLVGRSLADVPILCSGVVRFVGDPVAAVAAETRELAEEALRLIEVEYSELEAVFEPRVAIEPSAPVLHPAFAGYVGAPPEPLPARNLCAYACLHKGDVEAAFAAADVIREHHFSTPMQHQGYLEPQACVASFGADGVVRVWASNKAPFLVRNEVARILQLPPEQIVLEPTYVGGDFGGKGSAMEIPLAVLLSKAGGRPVRLVLAGAQEFTAGNPRHAADITIRSALTRDGRILARDIRMLFDGGAYAGYKPIPGVNLAAHFWSAGPYRTPNVRFESMVAYTNHVPAGHMRAPGIAQLAFAEEVDMDLLAHALDTDPLTFRECHALEDGDVGPLGETWHALRLKDCLAEVRRLSDWDVPRPENVGRGVAISHCAGGMGASSAVVELVSDGRVALRTAVSDQGSGSHTVLVQIVAHELGLPVDCVMLAVGGTDVAPFDSGSSASRVTYVGGLAAQRAAIDLRETLTALAAEYLGCPPDRVDYADGVFRDRERFDSTLVLEDLAARAVRPEAPLSGSGAFADRQLSDTPSFAALVAEVHVDPETGEISIRRLSAVYDVGTVINPNGIRGQLEGGLVQGLGMATMEELRLGDGGRVETVSLGDYKMPTVRDIPPSAAAWITETPGSGPFGAKSIGELTTPLLPAAISNAVYDAVGVRIVDLPLTAERVFTALRARESGSPYVAEVSVA